MKAELERRLRELLTSRGFIAADSNLDLALAAARIGAELNERELGFRVQEAFAAGAEDERQRCADFVVTYLDDHDDPIGEDLAIAIHASADPTLLRGDK